MDLLPGREREEGLQPEVCACGLASLDEGFWFRNVRARKGYVVTARSIPANRHCFDRAEDLAGLMKTIEAALDANLAFIDQLPAGLLEREALVFLAGAKRRRPLDLFFKESVPSAIEPVRYGLNCLRINQHPVFEAGAAQFGQMPLELALFQCLAE